MKKLNSEETQFSNTAFWILRCQSFFTRQQEYLPIELRQKSISFQSSRSSINQWHSLPLKQQQKNLLPKIARSWIFLFLGKPMYPIHFAVSRFVFASWLLFWRMMSHPDVTVPLNPAPHILRELQQSIFVQPKTQRPSMSPLSVITQDFHVPGSNQFWCNHLDCQFHPLMKQSFNWLPSQSFYPRFRTWRIYLRKLSRHEWITSYSQNNLISNFQNTFVQSRSPTNWETKTRKNYAK